MSRVIQWSQVLFGGKKIFKFPFCNYLHFCSTLRTSSSFYRLMYRLEGPSLYFWIVHSLASMSPKSPYPNYRNSDKILWCVVEAYQRASYYSLCTMLVSDQIMPGQCVNRVVGREPQAWVIESSDWSKEFNAFNERCFHISISEYSDVRFDVAYSWLKRFWFCLWWCYSTWWTRELRWFIQHCHIWWWSGNILSISVKYTSRLAFIIATKDRSILYIEYIEFKGCRPEFPIVDRPSYIKLFIIQVDRSPCGSGVTAHMATLYYKKKVSMSQLKRIHNSKIPHSTMT